MWIDIPPDFYDLEDTEEIDANNMGRIRIMRDCKLQCILLTYVINMCSNLYHVFNCYYYQFEIGLWVKYIYNTTHITYKEVFNL